MSLSELINPQIGSKPWMNTYHNTVHTLGLQVGTSATPGDVLTADAFGNATFLPIGGDTGSGVTNSDATIAVTGTTAGQGIRATGNFTGVHISTDSGITADNVSTQSLSTVTSLVVGPSTTWRYNNNATPGSILTSADNIGTIVWLPGLNIIAYGLNGNVNNSANPLIFNSLVRDLGTQYNTSTGIGTPNVQGWYAFTVQLSVKSVSSQNLNLVLTTTHTPSQTFQVNQIITTGGINNVVILSSAPVDFNGTTDTFKISFSSTSDVTVQGDPTQSYFSMYKVF